MANLAVIPARGGSKRIPRKNVKPLAGMPMIAHTIAAARDSGVFDRIVVSTDDHEIAAIARSFGADVPFLRSAHLADDHTPVSAVSLDMLTRLEAGGSSFDAVCQLMPNCPLRDADDIRASFHAFETSRHAAQISVSRYGWLNPWWALKREEDGTVTAVFEEQLRQRSQDLPALYCPTGAIWWIEAGALKAEGTFHIAKRSIFELPWYKAVDIDDEADFELAEVLLARKPDQGVDASA